MSAPPPSIIDRTKNWLRLLKRQSRSSTIHTDEKTGTGSFSNARDFTISGSQLIDTLSYVNEMKVNYINSVISSKDAVFELLEPYACLDATKDSSARHPPPRCHPETRLKIRDRLMQWLVNENDGWKMLWVRGSAGTGKSGPGNPLLPNHLVTHVGKSRDMEHPISSLGPLAETSLTVVPTIIYELATTIPEYRSLIGHRLTDKPLLLRNSPPVQFRELIVEPFTVLHRQHPRKPMVIILDGLDECNGEKAQREILDMITNAIRTNPDLPLRWLIFSRPEAHLKNAFSRNSECGREELIIDNECRGNVERYVRNKVVEIKAAYKDMMPVDWPPRDELQELLDAVSGLFVFASTCLSYIDDSEAGDPRSQLNSLLTFLRRSRGVVSRNPLAALDILYSRILDNIPATVFVITWRILAYLSLRNRFLADLDSAQALCNFLRLDMPTFYKAIRGLHSVMIIPEAEVASQSRLQFHHASFLDFLLDPHRSGKFVINEQKALAEVIRSGTYWYDVDVTIHTHDGWNYDEGHNHDSMPGLLWASKDNQNQLSRSIASFVEWGLLHPDVDVHLDVADEDLLSQISNFDFRYWYPVNVFLLIQLCRLDLSTAVVRMEPSSTTDYQLLEYFNLMIGSGIAKPAIFPLCPKLPNDQWIREYFFIRHGVKTVIVWRTKSPASANKYSYSLRCDTEPSEAQLSQYQNYLQGIGWDEEKARLEMK